MSDAIERVISAAVERGDPPAAQCVLQSVRRAETPLHQGAYGCTPEALFDVASVSKVLATTTAVAVLVARGELGLDDPVSATLEAFGAAGKTDVTVRELLGHRSGLPAWDVFFTRCEGRDAVLAEVFDSPLAYAPGTRVYSDLGFLALGALVEAVAGQTLEVFCREAIWRPLGLDDMGYRPLAWAGERPIVPTGRTRPREPAPGQEHLYTVPEQSEREDPGEVDDDNAWSMGGVAGHAGVFATAAAVARFGRSMLEEHDGADRLGIGVLLRTELFVHDPADGPPRALGWDVPSGPNTTVRAPFGDGARGAVGHLGFTGCSLWLDLDRGLSLALLTNRTLEGRHRVEGIRALRREVSALAGALG